MEVDLPVEIPDLPGRGTGRPLGIQRLSREIARRARAGEHVVIWGPRGAGKTTVLAAVEARLAGSPWGRSSATRSLDDITRALERAYPAIDTGRVSRKVARARLWRAADREPGVLLLDHANAVGTAMKGCLRRLRGGVVGIVLAVDVDSPRERLALRPYRVGTATLQMPALPARTLAKLLQRQWDERALLALPDAPRRSLLRAARGRPGWIAICVALAAESRYWSDGRLRVSALGIDTEMLLRGLPALPPAGERR